MIEIAETQIVVGIDFIVESRRANEETVVLPVCLHFNRGAHDGVSEVPLINVQVAVVRVDARTTTAEAFAAAIDHIAFAQFRSLVRMLMPADNVVSIETDTSPNLYVSAWAAPPMRRVAAIAAVKNLAFSPDFVCSLVTDRVPTDTLILTVSLAWIRRLSLPPCFWGGASE